MWRLLLVEDQEIVRQGLKVILEQDDQINVTYEAENGKEAIELLEKHVVDLVMMDVRMPIMNGVEATKIMKERWPDLKIIILTTFNDETYALETLKDGVNGFLLKTADSNKLIKSVYSCMKGGLIIDDDVSAKIIPKLLHKQKEKTTDIDVLLSPRELAIARLIGKGKTNKEIAHSLHLSVGTVKNHLTTILQKTNLRDRTQLAIYAVKHDLVD